MPTPAPAARQKRTTMPLRFTRRVRLLPGLRANLSKSGVSLSIGGRGAWYTPMPGINPPSRSQPSSP
jgi:hypothetical protein